jgi:hypothetical protein
VSARAARLSVARAIVGRVRVFMVGILRHGCD